MADTPPTRQKENLTQKEEKKQTEHRSDSYRRTNNASVAEWQTQWTQSKLECLCGKPPM